MDIGYGNSNDKLVIWLYVAVGIVVCIVTYMRMDDLLMAILAGAFWPMALIYYGFYQLGAYIIDYVKALF